ncbi:hypothetical protein CKO37_23425 [Rubrivivax gelatinosus]|nr:hypothetical protein [Rubrivivax gelatinosus]
MVFEGTADLLEYGGGELVGLGFGVERQQHLGAGFGDANSLRSASIQYTGHCFWSGGVSTTVNMR